MSEIKKQRVVSKFIELLRSGMDYTVSYMADEAGETVCIAGPSAQRIIKTYYKELISEEMIGYVDQLDCSHPDKVRLFAKEFDVCERESRLLIRYIKYRK